MLCLGGNFSGHESTQSWMEAERTIFCIKKQAKHSDERRVAGEENERFLNPFFHSCFIFVSFLSSSLSFLQQVSLSLERAHLHRFESCRLFSLRFACFVFQGYSSSLLSIYNSNISFFEIFVSHYE